MIGKGDLRIGSPRAAVIAHHGPAHRFNAAADAGVDHACSDLGGKQIDRIKTRRTEAMNLLASHCLRITHLEHRSAGKHATLLSHGLGHADDNVIQRSEEHTSELQSLMRISYAVFCLKKTTTNTRN